MTRLRLCLLVGLVALFAAGCWDRTDPDRVNFVSVLGIDAAEGGELDLTFEIDNPGPQQTRSTTSATVFTVRAESLPQALNIVNTSVGRRMSLEHLRLVVLGLPLLSERGLLDALGGFTRFREARRTVPVVAAQGSAGDLIRAARPPTESTFGRWAELITDQARTTGLSPLSRVHQLLLAAESPGAAPVLALMGSNIGGAAPANGAAGLGERQTNVVAGQIERAGGNPVELIGAVALRDDRPVGFLTGSEARLVAILRNEIRRAYVAVPLSAEPVERVTLDVRPGRATFVRVSWVGERIRVEVQAGLEADIVAYRGRRDIADPAEVRRLGLEIERRFQAAADAIVRRAQQEFRADIFGFGESARRLVPTWPAWVALDWRRRFPEAEIRVQMEIQIRRVGFRLAPPTAR